LGNLYSAQLLAAAREELEGEETLEEMWHRGEFKPLLNWMREKVHSRGSIITPSELIEEATGNPPSPEPFISYLHAKIERIYGVSP
jgi:carboxypeptidase Taq